MNTAQVIVTVSTLLSACVNLAVAAPIAVPAAPVMVLAAAQESSGAQTGGRKGAADDAPPEQSLTSDWLYDLLTGEIGIQRGDWQAGYNNTLNVARQSRDPRLARRAAEIAMNARQARAALDATRLWLELAPHSEEAAQYFMSFALLENDFGAVKAMLSQRLQSARPQIRGLQILQMQRLLARADDKAAALRIMDDVLAPWLNMQEAHLALAQAASASGDEKRAQGEARAALAQKPDSELAALTLAQVTSDKADAMAGLDAFLNLYPEAREVRIARARMLAEQRQFAQARKEFEILLKAQPEDPSMLYALGLLGTQANDFEQAERYLTRYVELLASRPDDTHDPTQALLILAQIAEDRKDTDAALKWLEQVDAGDAWIEALIRRAQIITRRGDLAAGRKLLAESGAESEREHTRIILADAQLLQQAGQVPEALAVLDQAVMRFPTNTDLLYDYAMVAEKLDRLPEMETTLRRVMVLAPDNQHAYNALGYSLAERNLRLPEALALIEKARDLAPEDPFIMDSLGWVRFRLGDLAAAEELLLCACAGIAPNNEGSAGGERVWHDAITLSGRLSAHYENSGKDETVHGSFNWIQDAAHSELTLRSPLGQTIAQIDVQPGLARLTMASQPPRSAPDADQLAAEALGWPLPVAGLRHWLQGYIADAGGRHAIRPPAVGNAVANASTDGWQLAWPAWEPGNAGEIRPRRIDLARSSAEAGQVNIRIVIDNWQTDD